MPTRSEKQWAAVSLFTRSATRFEYTISFFERAIGYIGQDLRERRQSAHAGVLWLQDELRLLAETSPYTMGLQD